MEQTADVQVVWNERKEEPLAYMTCWWRWMEQWLAMPLSAGTKSLVILHFVVVTTSLNRAMRNMVHDSAFAADILQLLKKTLQDSENRTAWFHNRNLLKSYHCQAVVECLRYFRKTHVRSWNLDRTETHWNAVAFIEYTRDGKPAIMSEQMIETIHYQWVFLIDRMRQVRRAHPENFSVDLTNALLEDRFNEQKYLQYFGSASKRWASIPLVVKGSRSRLGKPRSKSYDCSKVERLATDSVSLL